MLNIDLEHNTFEMLACCFRASSKPMIFVVVYRPGSAAPTADFFAQLIMLFEIIATYKSDVIILGDFNIHVNDVNDQHGQRLLQILDDFNLIQHVVGPTHTLGNTLDLVITSSATAPLLTRADPPVYSDHGLVTCLLPPAPVVTNTFKQLIIRS